LIVSYIGGILITNKKKIEKLVGSAPPLGVIHLKTVDIIKAELGLVC
jgi:hypothetical protein